MTPLTITQVQARLLDMARAVSAICEAHQIPFFMISGTMLGAIRHRGFIPWDDDMDFAVPREYYPQLIQALRQELPAGSRCVTYETSTSYCIPWIKVEDTATLVIDHSLDVPAEKMPGLTIDIFPLVKCDKEKSAATVGRIQSLLSALRIAYGIAPGSRYSLKNIAKRLFRLVLPLSQADICDRIQKLTDKIPSGGDYVIPVDPNYHNRYFPVEWFEPTETYTFGDCQFLGATDYDSYLKLVYGNYMQLPPEGRRRVHSNQAFMR